MRLFSASTSCAAVRRSMLAARCAAARPADASTLLSASLRGGLNACANVEIMAPDHMNATAGTKASMATSGLLSRVSVVTASTNSCST